MFCIPVAEPFNFSGKVKEQLLSEKHFNQEFCTHDAAVQIQIGTRNGDIKVGKAPIRSEIHLRKYSHFTG